MNLFEWIKYKIFLIVTQYNIIDKKKLIADNAYVSGSVMQGNVIIGDKCKIYQSHLEGNINIGAFSSIWGPNTFIIGRVNGISIGKFCSIARNVSIQEDYHNPKRITTYFLERNMLLTTLKKNAIISKGKIVIGNDVWIGAGVQILSGVNIAHGVVVGAGSVVTKDIPPYAVVGGNPAKIIKFRFNQSKIDELMALAWWNWSTEKIKENQDFLLSVLNSEEIKNA